MARDVAILLRRIFGQRVLGPDTPPVGRVQQYYVRRLILKIETKASVLDVRLRLRQVQQYVLSQPQYRSAQVYYDVDPV